MFARKHRKERGSGVTKRMRAYFTRPPYNTNPMVRLRLSRYRYVVSERFFLVPEPRKRTRFAYLTRKLIAFRERRNYRNMLHLMHPRKG